MVLREIRFGILLLDEGRRRQRLERWFEEGIRGPIAATALAHDLTVATLDQRDFTAASVRLADPSGS